MRVTRWARKVLFAVLVAAGVLAGGAVSATASPVSLLTQNPAPLRTVHVQVKSIVVYDDAESGWPCGDIASSMTIEGSGAALPYLYVSNGTEKFAGLQTWCSDTTYSTASFNGTPPVNKSVFKAEVGELLVLRLAGTEIDTLGGTDVTKAQGVLLVSVPGAGAYTDRSIMAEASGPAGHLRFKVNLRIRTF